MKRLLVQLMLLLAVAIVACQRIVPKENTTNATSASVFVRTATVQVIENNDFCGKKMALLLNDGSYILPTNWNTFFDEIVHNQTVQITYREAKESEITCTKAKSIYISHVDIPNASVTN